MNTVSGVVIAVQEQRFRMVSDSGQGLLLTLHNQARPPMVLGDLQRTRARVRVTYQGEPNISGGVARRIELI